jgi:hypothetical protein
MAPLTFQSSSRRGFAARRAVLALAALALLGAGAAYRRWSNMRCCTLPPQQPYASELPTPRPNDFSVDVAWSTGSVAPRYYYRQRLRLGSDRQVRLTFVPGVDADAPSWDATFTVPDSTLDALWASYQRLGLRRIPAAQPIPPERHVDGAGSHSGTVVASGQMVAFDDYRADSWSSVVLTFVERVQAITPDSLVQRLAARHAAWAAGKFGDAPGARSTGP